MSLGFIIIRHVNSKITDYYWKECYSCIRKFYDNPILIIDDSSNKEFLNENIYLSNCDIIYDTEHKGVGELLPYYYFHKLKPFDTAVIIHDSVFIQTKVNFNLSQDENIRFLWTYDHKFNEGWFQYTEKITNTLIDSQELIKLHNQYNLWNGCFGVMSVIRWSFLNLIDNKHQIFLRLLPNITDRFDRCSVERVLGLISYFNDSNIKPAVFGDIHKFITWETRFIDYLTNDYSNYPIIKVWSGR
jgi:hypothetical protein